MNVCRIYRGKYAGLIVAQVPTKFNLTNEPAANLTLAAIVRWIAAARVRREPISEEQVR